MMGHEQYMVRVSAVVALGEIGPAAANAVPRLIEVLEGHRPAIPYLRVVRALGRIGPAAASSIPMLTRILKATPEYPPAALTNPRHTLGRATAFALARIGADGITVLVKSLDEENPRLRLYAATALATADGQTEAAVAALRRLLRDSDEPIREAAKRALRSIQDRTRPSGSGRRDSK